MISVPNVRDRSDIDAIHGYLVTTDLNDLGSSLNEGANHNPQG
jgi:hypothetical protein